LATMPGFRSPYGVVRAGFRVGGMRGTAAFERDFFGSPTRPPPQSGARELSQANFRHFCRLDCRHPRSGREPPSRSPVNAAVPTTVLDSSGRTVSINAISLNRVRSHQNPELSSFR